MRLGAGVYLGGDGNREEILIDPLISGLRPRQRAREPVGKRVEHEMKKKKKKITGVEAIKDRETGDDQKR